MKKWTLISSIIIVMLILQTGCTSLSMTKTFRDDLDSTPSLQPSLTTTPLSIPSAMPTTAETYSIPNRPLLEEGPWLLVQDVDGVWALNPDGSGLTKIIDWTQNTMRIDSVRFIPAPDSSITAILEYDSSLFSFPILSLVSLPLGEVQYTIHLLSDSIEQILQDSERYMEVIDIFAAVGPLNQPAWSPDGQHLAFNAAIDGDSADLYTYTPATDILTRLTSGSTQSLRPFWSPRGNVIVQGGAEVIGWDQSGMGYQMDAMWAIRPADSSVKLLFVSEINGFENVLAWTSNTSALVDTLEAYCPYHNLRTVDIENGETNIRWQNGYDARAYDPSSNTLLIAVLDVNHPIPECTSTDPPGFYLLNLADDSIQALDIAPATEAEILYNTSADRFFIHTGEQLYVINAEGELTQFPAPIPGNQPLLISNNGDRWSFIDKDYKLWVGDDTGNLKLVYSGRTEAQTWNPEGDALLFLAEEEDAFILCIAPEPDFVNRIISADFDYPRMGDNLTWAVP